MADLLALLGFPALLLLQGSRALLDRVTWFGDPPSWLAVLVGAAVLLRVITLPLWIRSMAGERNEAVTVPVRAGLLAHRLPPSATGAVTGGLERTHPRYKSSRSGHVTLVGAVTVCMVLLWWSVYWGADPGGIGLKSLVDDEPVAPPMVFWQVFRDGEDPWLVLAAIGGGAVAWALTSYAYRRVLRGWLMPDWVLDWGPGGQRLRVAKYLVAGLLFLPFGALVFVVAWQLAGTLAAFPFLRRVKEPQGLWEQFVELDPYDGKPRVRPPAAYPGSWNMAARRSQRTPALAAGMPAPPMSPPPPLDPRAKPLLPGELTRIGDYQLAGRIGAGGMGTVYLARRAGSGTYVAIKTANGMVMDAALERERFAREAQTLALADGPYTARVLDSGVDHGRPYLVMELLDGLTLHDFIHRRGPITEPEPLCSLALALAAGLRTLHDLGVVHRDIKPGNVMLTSGGPKILDFGIALISDATRLTNTGVQLGTFAFMAPEQFADSTVTAAADMWAWACCLVFAATGKGPFDASDIAKITRKVTSAPPDPVLLEQLSDIDADLGVLVRDALDRRPAVRPTADMVPAVLCPEGDVTVHIDHGWRRLAGRIGA